MLSDWTSFAYTGGSNPSSVDGFTDLLNSIQLTNLKSNTQEHYFIPILGLRDEFSIIWESHFDIPDIDLLNVQFQITAWDNDISNPTATNYFHVDNDQGHEISLEPFAVEQDGEVHFIYTITDSSDDILQVDLEYSTDFQENWNVLTIEEPTDNIEPTNYDGEFTWISNNSIDQIEIEDLVVRAKVTDSWGVTISEPIIFHLDNNDPPYGDFSETSLSEEHDSIPFSINVGDEESDNVSIIFEYSVSENNWLLINQIEVGPEQYVSAIPYNWVSGENLNEVEYQSVNFRMILFDGNGINDYDTTYMNTAFIVDNFQSQTVEVSLATSEEEYSGEIDIVFVIQDSTLDNQSLFVEFKTDTTDWDTLTMADIDIISDLDSENYSSSFTWNTVTDLPNVSINAQVRIKSYDNWGPGPEFILQNIAIDNEVGPKLLSSANLDIYPRPSESILLSFDQPIDPESIEGNITMMDLPDIEAIQISDSLIMVTRPGGYPANSIIDLKIGHGLKDILGKSFDGNMNGDPDGSSEDDFVIKLNTYVLGDFDINGIIDGSDLVNFIEGWNISDFNYELAPIALSPFFSEDSIQFISQPDENFDIDDLMTFVRSWNYCQENNCLESPLLLSSSTPDDGQLLSAYNGNTLSLGFDLPNDLSTVEFTIEYNDQIITMGDGSTDSSTSSIGKSILLKKGNDKKNQKNSVIAYLEFEKQKNKNNWIINYPLELDGTFSEKIIVHYSYSVNSQTTFGRKEIEIAPIPSEFVLDQNYPNPFNPVTKIGYALPENLQVRIVIFDVMGREVKTLINEVQEAGYKSVTWDSRNAMGEYVATGVYFYQITAGEDYQIKKMLLMK